MRAYSTFGVKFENMVGFRKINMPPNVACDIFYDTGQKMTLDNEQTKEFFIDLQNILHGEKNGSTESKTEEPGKSGNEQESRSGSGGDIPA